MNKIPTRSSVSIASAGMILLLAVLWPSMIFAQGFGAPAAKPDTWVLIHAGTLLSVPGQAPESNRTIVIRNDRVERIEAGYLKPRDMDIDPGKEVRVVDLTDGFVMPGLMDAHVHLSRATGAFGSPFRGRGYQPAPGEDVVNATINARLSLAAGFTSLRDVGSLRPGVFAVRDAINAGKILGPTILAAGRIIAVTGGHGDLTQNTADPDERLTGGLCDSVDECRLQVRYHEKVGADLIKFSATGGFSDQTGIEQQMSFDEMQAIVEAARMRGMIVAAHAYEANAINDALRAGVKSIEHGYLLDDEGIRMMKKNNAFLVPTLTIAEPPRIARMFIGPGEPASVTMRNESAAFERAYKAGAKIAFGTDSGIYPHGENADEFVKMVEFGMSPADAIVTATTNTAELFGLENTGSILAGWQADIIGLAGNPLDDISALQTVDFVMKSGRVAKIDGESTLPIRYDLEHKY